MNRYFLSFAIDGEPARREVSLEDYCKAERAAGFRPKMASDDPRYMRTPATAGFSSGVISGHIEYGRSLEEILADAADAPPHIDIHPEGSEIR